MPLVKRVLEEHGGEVRVETQAGTGTTVALHLPRNRP
jgi:signal transduction histidine kinase